MVSSIFFKTENTVLFTVIIRKAHFLSYIENVRKFLDSLFLPFLIHFLTFLASGQFSDIFGCNPFLEPTHYNLRTILLSDFVVNRERDQIGTAVELFAQYDEESYRQCVEHIRKNNSGILSNDVIS